MIGTPSATTAAATPGSSTVKGSPATQHVSPADLEQFFSSDEEEISAPTPAPATVNTSRPSATQSEPSLCAKRKRDADEYSDFSADEEEALVALVNSSSQSSQEKRRDAFDTPAVTSRTHVVEDGMPSPLTERPVRRVLFADPEVSNSKKPRANGGLAASIHNRPLGSSPASTPSSSQEGRVGTPSKDGVGNMTQEVMSLLEGQKVDGNVLRNVRGTLEKYAAKAKGLERGRDLSREAAKKAESQIAELRQRVADLENQSQEHEEVRQKMRTEMLRLYRES